MAQDKQSSKNQVQVRKSNTIVPKIVLKGEVEHTHHLFKALVAKALKKDSYTPGYETPKYDIDHCHFFHTMNSMGTEQKYTPFINGHCHEVSWGVDDEGNLKAKCGPPLRKKVRIMKNGGQKVVYVPVEYRDSGDDSATRGDWITDKHVHEMEYQHSVVLTDDKISQVRKSNALAIGGPGSVQGIGEVSAPEGFSVAVKDTAVNG